MYLITCLHIQKVTLYNKLSMDSKNFLKKLIKKIGLSFQIGMHGKWRLGFKCLFC